MTAFVEHTWQITAQKKFSGSRERGEWFRPTPDLIEFIQEEAQP